MGSLYVPYGVAMPPYPRRVPYVYYEQYLTVVAEGLWGPYGVPMGSLWDVPYGLPMGCPLWGRNAAVPPQGDVCVLRAVPDGGGGGAVGSLWGSLYVPYGLPVGCPLWSPFGVPMGSLWAPYGVPCMFPMGCPLWGPYGMSPMGSQCRRPPAG